MATSRKPDPMVEHPPHYRAGTVYEAIRVIEAWGLGFHLGNAVKYICRADFKDNRLQNLQKARWYIDREIQNLEAEVRNEGTGMKVAHSIDVNDYVWVELSPAGEAAWSAYWSETHPGGVPDTVRKGACVGGKTRFQLWQLMHIFGPSLYLGSAQMPFVGAAITFSEETL